MDHYMSERKRVARELMALSSSGKSQGKQQELAGVEDFSPHLRPQPMNADIEKVGESSDHIRQNVRELFSIRSESRSLGSCLDHFTLPANTFSYFGASADHSRNTYLSQKRE